MMQDDVFACNQALDLIRITAAESHREHCSVHLLIFSFGRRANNVYVEEKKTANTFDVVQFSRRLSNEA